MSSDAAYEAAGLFDPKTDEGTGRLDLLRWLSDRGFTIDEMAVALRTEALGSLAGDRQLVPGERLGDDESRRLSGLGPEEFARMATAFGFAPTEFSSGGLELTSAEVEAIARFGALMPMFSDEEGLGFVRVVGNSIARIAEAAVSMFLIDIEAPHFVSDGNELVLAQKVLAAVSLLDDFIPLLDPILRRHMMQSIERGRRSLINETERLQYRYAIGFIDLVGFTPISRRMEATELAGFIRHFEGRAHDVVTAAGGRLVKLIGDEVMFAAPTARSACLVAAKLMSAFPTPDGREVEPRGGMSYGDVVVRGGDYYGQVVNLAARLVDAAEPSELLVSADFAEVGHELAFAPAGARQLKGFDEPVEAYSYHFG